MPAYLDHAATSPLRPEALAAMLPYLTEHFGNPSGSHSRARRARDAVEQSRETVAVHLGCEPGEVVFTAGGTESCNLAVLGAQRARGGAVVCSAVEHHAVLRPAARCAAAVVAVDGDGVVDLDALARALHRGVGLVSVMTANNELGTLQPLAEVVALVRALAPDALVHTDAVAAAGTVDLAAAASGADLVSIAAHKFGGPQGVGALVVRGATHLAPVLYGGAQERERRPGTHDVAGIVGMGAALAVAGTRRAEEGARIAALRDRLVAGLEERVEGLTQTVSSTAARLPGVAHVRVEGVDQEELLLLLDQHGICASAGAACASGAIEPSHVLLAVGLSPEAARRCVRFSVGWGTTDADVEAALETVPKAVAQLRR
ncbi:MAG: cysteine desulfurase family protein [Acidimicrobiales bacterium]